MLSRPSALVSMIRPEPGTSPYQAKFQVPLDWGKLDLKDYLYHAYNVEALRIRSYVQQQPIRRFKPHADSQTPQLEYWRPQSKKFMMIAMKDPFVWPKEPEDWSP
jgi:large subunit ribosomal protein L23